MFMLRSTGLCASCFVYVPRSTCLLLCHISMFARLDLGFAILCALYGLVPIGLWGHLRIWLHPSRLWYVWMWQLVRHISVILVCLLHTVLCSVRCRYACLACFVPPIWLSLLHCIFARLPTSACMSLCVVRTPIQWNFGLGIIYIAFSRGWT